MGCDIHCSLEHIPAHHSDGSGWRFMPLASELEVFRDYDVFALMAGVRGEGDISPVSEPKGLPEDVSDEFLMHAGDRIDDATAAQEVDGYCTREEAERWVRGGESVYLGDDAVTNPDWHSMFWLDIVELKEVQRHYRLLQEIDPLELGAIIDAMRALDNEPGGRSRLVFW